MSGIGNTVETDLVGEVVQIWQRDLDKPRRITGGRIRAMTTNKDGSVLVWLELLTQEDASDADVYLGRPCHQVGDIVCMTITSSHDWGSYSTYLRLIKS